MTMTTSNASELDALTVIYVQMLPSRFGPGRNHKRAIIDALPHQTKAVHDAQIFKPFTIHSLAPVNRTHDSELNDDSRWPDIRKRTLLSGHLGLIS